MIDDSIEYQECRKRFVSGRHFSGAAKDKRREPLQGLGMWPSQRMPSFEPVAPRELAEKIKKRKTVPKGALKKLAFGTAKAVP